MDCKISFSLIVPAGAVVLYIFYLCTASVHCGSTGDYIINSLSYILPFFFTERSERAIKGHFFTYDIACLSTVYLSY